MHRHYDQEAPKIGLSRNHVRSSYPPPQFCHEPFQLPSNSHLSQSPRYPSPQSYPQVQPGYSQNNPNHPAPSPGYLATISNYSPCGTITNQPTSQGHVNWMHTPQATPNCPSGLEYLASVDQLLVKQHLELLEIITDFEIENKYSIYNSSGQMVYYAAEESGCCNRNCCGSSRSFEMSVCDNFGKEVIHFSRPLKCQSCCCFCCLQTMEVSSPPGSIIGTVEQNWNPIFPSFSIRNSSGHKILQIKGPFCTAACCCSDVEFKIFFADDNLPAGKITKKWSGYVMEAFTNADNFGISFPKDLDVEMKAVLLGALFLIDMMYYEQKQ